MEQSTNQKKRVVITGLGAITPVGSDVNTFWKNMKAGKSGADVISQFDIDRHFSKIACEVKDFEPTDWLSKKMVKRLARSTHFAIASAKQALADSTLDITDENASSIGVVFNSGGGGITHMEAATKLLEEKGPRAISPFLVTNIMLNAVSCSVSLELGTTGPLNTSALACASGNYALLDAYQMIQRGEAEVIIAGGAESMISPLIIAAFGRMQALSRRNDDPQRASRPFDKNRDGFVFGEAAAAFILETEAHAKARGARIYAEILGGRLTSDAFHLTAPEPEGRGAIAALSGTLVNCGKTTTDVDAIFAHGTSTPLGDTAETFALKKVFGDHAYHMPVTSTKSQIGHTLGAAGAISALAAVKGIEDGMICPTINYETPDPECDLDYVPNEARACDINLALINAFGFGGQNVVLAIGRYSN
ncbi:beta-ketoacyl-ACP synthase II [Anaerolineales bacterium HSG24]|nr:beta-ketoacyl-ACP synthase II [Anaerolineales bacterium HSG24]